MEYTLHNIVDEFSLENTWHTGAMLLWLGTLRSSYTQPYLG